MVYNQQDYNSEEYGARQNAIQSNVKYRHISFDVDRPFLEALKMEEHHIETDENFFNPGWFDSEVYQLYHLNDK